MNLTIKKLIEILLKDKKLLVVFFLVSILFYPIYFFSYKLNENKVIFKVDSMYNYAIPNSISSLVSDTFVNLLNNKVQEKDFLRLGYYCNIINNDALKTRSLECISETKNKDEKFKDFKKLIYEYYNKHIDDLYASIEYTPFAFIDLNKDFKSLTDNTKYLLFLKKEKTDKFYLNISMKEKINKFTFSHYIISFILIFFLNIFRIIFKY